MGPSVAVVGAGPAGLMAAEVLATAGAAVTVYELHRAPGRKLLLAGRSGLNLTHAEDLDRFLTRYDPPSPALIAAINTFTPDQLRAWAAGLGQPTFVGSSGRVFPEAHRAAPLLRAWLARLTDLGVEMRTGHRWVGWDGDRLRFSTAQGEVVANASATVIALGGASWPRVSSDGGWASVLSADDVDVTPLRPSNCGVLVAWSDVFRSRFEGLPVKNVETSWDGHVSRGELVVTRTGLEGGPVYALSGRLGRDARFPTPLVLDLAPDLTADALSTRLARRRTKESQSTWLRGAGLAPIVVGLVRESTGGRIPDDAASVAALVKSLPIDLIGLSSIDRAISTAGGVTFDSVDAGLMLRRRPGVFVAGEMLDWDAPTGGYLLQACFATGQLAGRSAAGFIGLAA